MDFGGSGYKGFEFELKGYQERNVETLIKTLSTKEAQTTIKELAKIEKDSWKQMGIIMLSLKDMSVNGIAGMTDLGFLDEFKSSLTDTLNTQINAAIAPLKNELMSMINTLLAPIMPFLEAAINELSSLVSRGTGAIEALLSGNFDEWLKKEKLRMQPEVNKWNEEWYNFRAEHYFTGLEDLYKAGRLGEVPQWAQDVLAEYGSFAAWEAAANAAGIYSGQFNADYSGVTVDINLGVDMSPEAIAARLAALGYGDYTNEEEE